MFLLHASCSPKDRNSVLWNAMIHPLLNMTIKGAIWYQGTWVPSAHVSQAHVYSVKEKAIHVSMRFWPFQVRKMQAITRTSTIVLSLLWLTTGGWRFIRAQGDRQLLISPLGLSRYVSVLLWLQCSGIIKKDLLLHRRFVYKINSLLI